MDQTLRRTPFLRLLFPFVFGVVLQYQNNKPDIVILLMIPSVVSLILHLILKKTFQNRWTFGVFIFLFCVFLGTLSTYFSLQKTIWDFPEKQIFCTAVLIEFPTEKKKTVMCKLQLESIEINDILQSIDKKVIAYFPKNQMSTSLKPGKKLAFQCKFTPLKKTSEQAIFDYNLYLIKQGYAAIGYVKNNTWKCYGQVSNLKYKALECQSFLMGTMGKMGLSDKSYALAAALLLGYRDLMDVDLNRSFTSSGVSHVISISGLHVQIIYFALCFLFAYWGNNTRSRIIRQLIILPCIWLFAFITGLSPSVVRSAAMLSFYGIGEMIGKKSVTLNIVFASALLMLLYNPMYLFDVSFQLSYGAVLSIIIIYPMLESLHKTKNPMVKYVWGLFCVSLSAQLGVTPLCIYYFHQFPVYFLLTNLLIVPLISPVLIGMIISLSVRSFLDIPAWCFFPVEYLLRIIVQIVEFIEKLPFAIVENFYPNEIQVALTYIMLFFVVFYLKNRRVLHFYLFQLFLFMQVIYSTFGV